jgi:hypothetical protein
MSIILVSVQLSAEKAGRESPGAIAWFIGQIILVQNKFREMAERLMNPANRHYCMME